MYKLVTSNQIVKFEELVNKMLSEGWQLHGGTLFSNTYYCQAMLKPTVSEVTEVSEVKPTRSKK